MSFLEKIFIQINAKWQLNKTQSAYLKRLSIYDICIEINKHILVDIKKFIMNTCKKRSNFFLVYDRYLSTSNGDEIRVAWVHAMLEIFSHTASDIIDKSEIICNIGKGVIDKTLKGMSRYILDAIHNSDIYSKPTIIPQNNFTVSSSVFQNLGPNAIISIG